MVLIGALIFLSTISPGKKIPLDNISLPPGFGIHLFSGNVPGARSLALGRGGTVFVGTRSKGQVYALRDTDGDHRADEIDIIASGLTMPNGVAVKDGDLYVAEMNRILRFPEIESRLRNPPAGEIVYDRLPRERHHGWRYIRFGPDGYLYVSIGAPCNVCEKRDIRYGTIVRMNKEGKEVTLFSRGVRNSVGFDWNPETGVLWFSDNGRDGMGDTIPPDEVNRAARSKLHFGFPYCHGGVILDPEFGQKRSCDEFVSPEVALDAHVAPIGMRFYNGRMFPKRFRGNLFIALHGSWDRSIPQGYMIIMVKVKNGKAVGKTPFATGWLSGRKSWGRPVDLLVLRDGSLLVSDDKGGRVYRIFYSGRN